MLGRMQAKISLRTSIGFDIEINPSASVDAQIAKKVRSGCCEGWIDAVVARVDLVPEIVLKELAIFFS